MSELSAFYEKWSKKENRQIQHDIDSAVRKAEKILEGLAQIKGLKINSILDFGCGYGKVLEQISNSLNISSAYGFDFSQEAIDFAKSKYENDTRRFHKFPSLDIKENLEFIRSKDITSVDAVILTDMLEHIPDCRNFISEISKITKYFLIKLPLEYSILDNYVLKKSYPGYNHQNGHLREFDANSVYYFIRELGLMPLYEDSFVYHIEDSFPPYNKYCWKYRLVKLFKEIMSVILPKRIYLVCVGGGGYYCVAEFSEALVLNP